jgi:surface antigen
MMLVERSALGAEDPGMMTAAGVALALSLALAAPVAAQDADAEVYNEVLSRTLEEQPSGVEVAWSNPATGRRGVIVVERTFYRDRTPCRSYRRTVEGGGTAERIAGIGCRDEDGRWQLEEQAPPVAAAPPPPPSCPPLDPGQVVRVPCARPPAFTEYTLPDEVPL